MSDVLFENTQVFKPKEGFSAEDLREKFAAREQSLQKEYVDNTGSYVNLKKLHDNLVNSSDENSFDYTNEELAEHRDELAEKQLKIREKIVQTGADIGLLDKYENSFAALYQIKEQNENFGGEAECSFKEITQDKLAGITAQEQYYEMSANPKGEVNQLALQVKLPTGEKFDLTMPPYDKPGADGKEIKAQLSFDEKSLQDMNAENLARIMEFCETHGLPTFQMDVPYSFDGNVNVSEKMKELLAQVKEQKSAAEKENNQKEFKDIDNRKKELERSAPQNVSDTVRRDLSYDLPDREKVFAAEEAQGSELPQSADKSAEQVQPAAEQNSAEMPEPAKKEKPKKTIADAEAGLEKFLQKGLSKKEGYTYFKEHTGWFGRGWTEYIVYDTSDPDNRKKDGQRDKNGIAKFTYNFKLFVKEENGKFSFAYKTPGNKKIDDSVVNGMVGQMKDLGITRVRFPDGLPDAEKKLWRIALAENGIVPVGMGLDKAKAEGMLKAAKEKLTSEAYIKYRYRLAKQMDKENKDKGKVISPSEQDYIDGIMNSQKYMAFTEGYGTKLKGMLRDRLDAADTNHNDGAIDKTASYKALRRLFDAYKESVDNANLLGSKYLSSEEKQKLKHAGLTGPVSEFSADQMGQLYEIMLVRSTKEAKEEIDQAMLDAKDLKNRTSKGAKRADNVIIKEAFDNARNRFEKVNELLAPLGVEEISFPKSFGGLYYDNFYKEHPEFLQRQQQQTNTPAPQQNKPTSTKSVESAGNSEMAKAVVQAYAAKKGKIH